MIRIFVGKDHETAQPFVVPKAMLCRASEYFEKALQQGFKEGEERTLHFPDDRLDSWHAFLYWLYHKEYPHNEYAFDDCGNPIENEILENTEMGDEQIIVAEERYAVTAAHAWIFGDKNDISGFQNEAMTCLLHHYIAASIDIDLVSEVFQKTLEGSQLRKMMASEVASSMYTLRGQCLTDFLGDVGGLTQPPGFSQELSHAQMEVSYEGKYPEGYRSTLKKNWDRYMVQEKKRACT